jgi:hypothetical protein
MNVKRFLLASLVVFAVGMVWGGLVHLVLLREANAAIAHLTRPDLAAKMWMSVLASAGFALLFVLGYSRVARRGTVGEGILYGAFFAAVAGLLVDVNQYVLYPIPGTLACTWFLAGLVEFGLYGALASWLYPVASRERAP